MPPKKLTDFFSKPVKSKPSDRKDIEELTPDQVSEFWGRGKKRKAKSEPEIIDIDEPEKAPSRAELSKRKKTELPKNEQKSKNEQKPSKTDQKAVKTDQKTIKTDQKTAKTDQNQSPQNSGETVHQVLSRIADVDLNKVAVSDGKFDFSKSQAQPMDIDPPELPQGRPGCLTGVTFVFTGNLPTLSRPTATEFVQKYGARVTGQPSKKTTCIVIGEDAGPSKVQKIKSLGLKVIDQDGLLQLVREMPAHGGSGEEAVKAREKERVESQAIKTKAEEMRQSSQQRQPEKTSSKQSTAPSSLWTTKHAPQKMEDICGNNTQVQRLKTWLLNWRDNHRAGFPTGRNEGSGFRAVIIHGPPGIGKTTAAHIVAESCGFDVIEYNASDTRSKSLLNNVVSSTLTNTSLEGFWNRGEKQLKPLCVIMDEVDGMSAGDRGGVGAMSQFARTTNVPLILICNERSLPKLRPFDRVTYDMPFRRPDVASVRRRISAIAAAEGLELDLHAVDQLFQLTGNDIRQTLNLLSTYSTTAKSMSPGQASAFAKSWTKDVVLRPFDILGRYLSPGTWSASSQMSFNDKMDLYFNDYDFAPLMMQENYLNVNPLHANSTKGGALELIARAAESISDGDLTDRLIHGSQQLWTLMPLHAVFSCVRPSFLVHGQGRGRFAFTSYLGNNSKATKYRRLLHEVQAHTRLRLWATHKEFRLDYQSALAERLLLPLEREDIATTIDLMDGYYLTKEDFDTLMELSVGKDGAEVRAKKLPTKLKSSFTRTYNAQSHPLPFMRNVETKVAVSKASVPDLDGIVADDLEPEPEEEKGDDLDTVVAKDKYIKRKTTKAKAKAEPKTKAKPKAKGKAKAS